MNSSNACTKTVVIVEDDEGIRISLQDILEEEGYRVTTAKNGQEAIDVLAKISEPCLILLDMFMPVMDGWQFLERMKLGQEDQVIHTPIVITSAAGDRAKDAAKQVNGFIKKPIELDLLLAIVLRYCGSRS